MNISRVVTRIQDQDDFAGSPSDGQVMTFDATMSKWKAATPSAATASLAIGTTISGSPIAGQVLFADSTGKLAQSSVAIASGIVSSPGAGVNSQAFGLGATAGGANALSVGGSAGSLQALALGIGASVDATSGQAMAVGTYSLVGPFAGSAIAIGPGTRANSSFSIAFGFQSVADAGHAVAFGRSTWNNVANSIVFGANSSALIAGKPFDTNAFISKLVVGRSHVDVSPLPAVVYTTTGGSGADIGGSDIVLAGGISTGLGSNVNPRGDAVRLQVAPRALASGSSAGTLVDRLIVAPEKSLTNGTAANILGLSLPSGSRAGLIFQWSVEATDGTDHQVVSGQSAISLVNKAGTLTSNVSALGTPASAVSAGTLAVVFDASLVGNIATIRCNAASSLTASTGYPRLHFTLLNQSALPVSLV